MKKKESSVIRSALETMIPHLLILTEEDNENIIAPYTQKSRDKEENIGESNNKTIEECDIISISSSSSTEEEQEEVMFYDEPIFTSSSAITISMDHIDYIINYQLLQDQVSDTDLITSDSNNVTVCQTAKDTTLNEGKEVSAIESSSPQKKRKKVSLRALDSITTPQLEKKRAKLVKENKEKEPLKPTKNCSSSSSKNGNCVKKNSNKSAGNDVATMDSVVYEIDKMIKRQDYKVDLKESIRCLKRGKPKKKQTTKRLISQKERSKHVTGTKPFGRDPNINYEDSSGSEKEAQIMFDEED
ncbi:hypothetical protein ABK040_003166 [Willaertia magna]